MPCDERHFHRFLIHVQWECAVSLAPKAVMSAGEPIVRGKHHKRVLRKAQFVQRLQNVSDPYIHGSNSRKIANQIRPLIFCYFIRQVDAVRMPRQMRHRFKQTVFIQLCVFFGVVIEPRRMRSRIGHMQIKRFFCLFVRI